MLKLLTRVLKLRDIIPEVKQVISTLFFMKQKIGLISDCLSPPPDTAVDLALLRRLYAELIALVSKAIRKMAFIQTTEPFLQRPFVLEGVQYDERTNKGYFYSKVKKVRAKMLLKEPRLHAFSELQQVVLPNGAVGPITLDPDYEGVRPT